MAATDGRSKPVCTQFFSPPLFGSSSLGPLRRMRFDCFEVFHRVFFPRGNIYLVFLIDWMTQMNLSVVFFVVVLLHGVYFLGMCSYIRTMVDDCKTDLSGLDVSFRDRASVGLSGQYALVEGVRFHSKIIE